MSSLFAEYIKERENFEIIEDEKGFATYRITNQECFIGDMFILKEFRGGKSFIDLISQITDIAKTHGCKILTATVRTWDQGKEHSLSSTFKLGFKILKAEQGIVLVGKEI